MRDKYGFLKVWVMPPPSFSGKVIFEKEDVDCLVREFEVLIEGLLGDDFSELRVFVKMKGRLQEIGHDMPCGLINYIIKSHPIDAPSRAYYFSYWYNQFDPDLGDFDDIQYLFQETTTENKD